MILNLYIENLSKKLRWILIFYKVSWWKKALKVRTHLSYLPQHSYLCRRSLSDVKSRYSEMFRPVMSTRMSPVTTFIRGGRPPTPLGHEKPVPCMEQVQRTGSWTERGRVGGDVTGSEQPWKSKSTGGIHNINNAFIKGLMLDRGEQLNWLIVGLFWQPQKLNTVLLTSQLQRMASNRHKRMWHHTCHAQ